MLMSLKADEHNLRGLDLFEGFKIPLIKALVFEESS